MTITLRAFRRYSWWRWLLFWGIHETALMYPKSTVTVAWGMQFPPGTRVRINDYQLGPGGRSVTHWDGFVQ